MESIKVFAPATVANVAVGFDIMGFALDNPGDIVQITKRNSSGLELIDRTGYGIPLNPEKNTGGMALLKFLEHLNSNQGFTVEFIEKIRPGSGVGSSAASSAACLYAANLLLGEPLTVEQLVPFAMEGERVASGSAHADNVSPALMGGFVLIRSYKPLDLVRLAYPPNLHCTVVHPQIEVRTEDARKILKRTILLKDAIAQWGNTAGLIAGLFAGDYGLIGRSLDDIIVEPIRALLIPAFDEVKQTALHNGAIGCSISGSGPSIFAFSSSLDDAQRAGKAMQQKFEEIGIESFVYVSRINQQGPKVLESR